ncbi:MAG: PEP-CTERM sorting domain-containing protein [Terriglobales bacterium]
MKLRWALPVVILAVGWTLPALATPQIGLGDPTCASANPADFTGGVIQNVTTGNSFTITPVNGGGFFGICNDTGTLWTTVDITFTSSNLTLADITCYTTNGVFDNPCTKSQNGSSFDLHFSGGTGIPGHAPCADEDLERPDENSGCLMTVNLNGGSTTADGDWDHILLTGTANVPEPATFALLGSGLAGLWQYRRRRK